MPWRGEPISPSERRGERLSDKAYQVTLGVHYDLFIALIDEEGETVEGHRISGPDEHHCRRFITDP